MQRKLINKQLRFINVDQYSNRYVVISLAERCRLRSHKSHERETSCGNSSIILWLNSTV